MNQQFQHEQGDQPPKSPHRPPEAIQHKQQKQLVETDSRVNHKQYELQLTKLLKQARIDKEEEVQECIDLFRTQNFDQLKEYPSGRFRQKFCQQLDRLLLEMKYSQAPQQHINIQNQFREILVGADIREEQEYLQLLNLFTSNQKQKLQELKKYPAKKYRQKFATKIEQLAKIYQKKCQKKQSRNYIQQQIISLLNRVAIKEPDEINQCVQLFKANRIEDLLEVPSKKYYTFFKNSLNEILAKINPTNQRNKKLVQIKEASSLPIKEKISKVNEQLSKQQKLQQALNTCGISREKRKQYIHNLKNGELKFFTTISQQLRRLILNTIDNTYSFSESCSMQTQILVSLTIHHSDTEIKQICKRIIEGKDFRNKLRDQLVEIIQDIIEKFSSTLIFYLQRGQQISLKVNQMQRNNRQFLKSQIGKLTGRDISKSKIFYQGNPIQIENIGFQPGKSQHFYVYEVKIFNIKYNNKVRKINLLPEKTLNYNKQIILEELKKKDLVLNESQAFNLSRLRTFFYNDEGVKRQFNQINMTLCQIEESINTIAGIIIQVTLKITLYYEDLKEQFRLSSADKLIQLRKIINQKHIPFASQILYLEEGEQNKNSLQQSRDQEKISLISSKSSISFTLANRCSLQFYGFYQNIPLSFEDFSEFFVEDEQSTKNIINCFSFTNKKEQQLQFIQYFFSYLFSGIKRRFPIQTVINKFKNLVSKIKSEAIWNPSEGQSQKLNEAFVFAFMLKNADSRLRIQLMNLLRQNVPIPLYFRDFENISKVSNDFKLNEQLLWILKEGFTIASIGLHSKQRNSNEVGKSSLLNEIFTTRFHDYKEKHQITRGIPYIAVRIFQNIVPIHIIDIPQDCLQPIKEQILKNSNLIFIHSWRNQAQTQNQLSILKSIYEIPTICLIRDCKEKISMKNLKGNCLSLEQPQKVNSFAITKNSFVQITILKDQIFKFIKQKIQNKQDKIFGLYRKNELFRNFTQLLVSLQKNLLNLAKIGQLVESIRRQQKSSYYEEQLKKKKALIKQKLSPQLKKILQFLMKQEVKFHRNLLLGLLRQKLKTYQNQMNIKYLKIYEFRDTFEKIKEITIKQQKIIQISKLNQQLKLLQQLKPVSIIKKQDAKIAQIIKDMINIYENKIKPKIFSVELFWRQFNYLLTIDQNYKIAGRPLIDILSQLKEIEINSNLPFQIIDGDMLQMPRKLLKSLFENKDEKFITISILGPQSSGKSTLLNFMFGCDFSTSEGRCTRGVYGTYFRFAQNKGHFGKIPNCSGIFVIDTQGLFAITNQKDKEDLDRKDFDSKLILFCLAVSDFVVINVRGNFDKNTQKMVRLCHQRLQQLNKDKDRRPEIIVVLNQNASDKKDQSQNEFKQIKKTIDYDISRSLSFAYQIINYGHQEISLFGKNQKLTKKYPLQAFLKETTILMNIILSKIMRKTTISKLYQIIQNFQITWSMLISFPNLSKPVTNQYRELQKSIKKFKDQQGEQQQSEIQKMLNLLQQKKITEVKIFEYIQSCQRKALQAYDAKFKEHYNDDEQIRQLKKQQRKKIKSKTSSTENRVRYQLKNIQAKEQINISRIQGDHNLKEKAKQICKKQINNNKNISEKEKKGIFDQCFNQQLKRIEQITNLQDESRSLYDKIYEDYLFLVKEQSKSQRGLPKRQMWKDGEKLELNNTVMMLKQRLIDPEVKSYEDVLFHTHKIHTNILKGGKTDAGLQYFNMKDYFKVEQTIQSYGISQSHLHSCLKKTYILQQYKQKLEKERKKIKIRDKLSQIWQQINSSLSNIGIKFTNFQQFKQLYENYQQKNIFYKFFNFFTSRKQQISFTFLNNQDNCQAVELEDINFNSSKARYHYKSCQHNLQQVNDCLSKMKIYQNEKYEQSDQKQEATLTKYIIEIIDNKHIYDYKKHQAKQYLARSFYKHINWKLISEVIQINNDYISIQRKVNEDLTQEFNQDIKCLNLKVVSTINWKDILSQEINIQQSIQFYVIQKNYEIKSTQKYYSKVQLSNFLVAKNIQSKIKKLKGQTVQNVQTLSLFKIKTMKLQPDKKNTYFKSYLAENNKLTINQLQKPEVKKFIFNELKNNKKSFDKFYNNVFKIVKNVIKSWQKLEKNTLAEIYNKVSQEICKFNNDLNQISCNLNHIYIGYINLSVVNMIWKLIIDQKIKEKQKMIQDKKKQYQNEWNLFMTRTSNDEQKNLQEDVNQFIKEFKNILNESIKREKQNLISKYKQNFKKQYPRPKIQQLIDIRVFRHQTNPKEILAYLENPQQVIIEKYNECYDESWRNLNSNYSFIQTIGYKIMEEFYQLLNKLMDLFIKLGFDGDNKMFSDFFKIKGSQQKALNDKALQTSYLQQGKRVFFQCFIDILLNDNPNKNRKCAKVQIYPIKEFPSLSNSTAKLREILIKLKSVKSLQLANLINFVKKILIQTIKAKFKEEIKKLSALTSKDKQSFINSIRVSVCDQKCPCCGRICGIENEHLFHKCLYGHQMRGLNGTYIQRQNNVREASVIRCQNMAQTDLIKYNGKQYTWLQFKEYWKAKDPGGWLFDDATLKINQSQLRFEQAWTIAGPIYCEEHSINFVQFNKAESQLKEQQLVPIHYIFALDQSGSMNGIPWQNLMKSLKQTVQKIKAKDNNRNMLKISIIKFNQSIQIVCENYNPSQVNSNLSFRGGRTNFDLPFNEAARIARKYIDNSIIVLIFMTDGGASYPTNGIQALKSLQMAHPNKLHYSGIQFNCSQRVMKLIASQLKGTSGEAYNPEMLTTLFKRSIQIVEFKQGK